MSSRGIGPHLLRWVIVGLMLRLILSAFSFGSDDAGTWARFGDFITTHSLLDAYRYLPDFNHPPIIGLYAGLLDRLSHRASVSFLFLFRLAPILIDALTTIALVRYTGKSWVATLFALDLTSIIVSAFHTNTDSIYAGLLVLAVIALCRGKDILAGTLFGAAVNVKLLPLIILIPILASLPLRRLYRMCIGGLPWIVPYLIVIRLVPDTFLKNVLQYTGAPNYWGSGYVIGLLIRPKYPEYYQYQSAVSDYTSWFSRSILLIVLCVGLLWKYRRSKLHLNPATLSPSDLSLPYNHPLSYSALAGTVAGIFFSLTPNFASQYAVLLLPLMLLTAPPRLALAWSITCGLFCLTLYGLHWNHQWPLSSPRTGFFISDFYGILQVPAWLICCTFTLRSLYLALTTTNKEAQGTSPQASSLVA